MDDIPGHYLFFWDVVLSWFKDLVLVELDFAIHWGRLCAGLILVAWRATEETDPELQGAETQHWLLIAQAVQKQNSLGCWGLS